MRTRVYQMTVNMGNNMLEILKKGRRDMCFDEWKSEYTF